MLQDEEREILDVAPQATTLDPGRTLRERLDRIRQSGQQGITGLHLADLVRAGSTLGDSLAGHRTLGREDRTVLSTTAIFILLVAVLAGFFPFVVGWFLAILTGWFGIVLGVRAIMQTRRAKQEEEQVGPMRDAKDGPPRVEA